MTAPAVPRTRRVATGLDSQGRSCIAVDDLVPAANAAVGLAWATATSPADNLAPCPPVGDWWELTHAGGSTFILVRMVPGASAPMHATDTIDYITMLSGEMTIVTQTGEAVLRAGDLFVDRGILHAWRNDGAVDAVYTVVTIAAHPVGAGRTDPPLVPAS